MALMDWSRTNRSAPQVVPFGQHLRDMRRVLLHCENTDVMLYPTDDERRAKLIEGIAAVAQNAGFTVVDVHFINQGQDDDGNVLAMGVVISHKSGTISLGDCLERTNSLDLVITYRGENLYTALRCCELMQEYFDAEGILLS